MKKIIFLIIVLFVASCDEETRYETQINLENNTNYDFEVTLFPKLEFVKGTLYKFSDIGSGHNPVTFTINPNSENNLFITKNMDIEPYSIAQNIFDSIYVVIDNELQTRIVFKVDTAINYSENLFSPNSLWIFEKVEYDMQDMFNENPVVADCYTFVIH